MKKIIYILIVIFTIIACSTASKNTAVAAASPKQHPEVNDTVRIANDSLEYEVIIIDNGLAIGWRQWHSLETITRCLILKTKIINM
ncbi:hypothetical protein D3C85_730000 [compost metagenome]